jgi:hypothetical protein
MPIADWLELMPDTVTHTAMASRDDYGKPVLASGGTDYRARVVYKTQKVASRVTGEDVIANCQVWINGVISGLTVDDQIELPDGSTPRIESWDIPSDETGQHHMKIFLRA